MKILDIQRGNDIRPNTGIHILFDLLQVTYILVNSDFTIDNTSYYGKFHPGIDQYGTMKHMLISDIYVDRKYNVHRLNIGDFIYINPIKLNKSDVKMLERRKKEILNKINSNRRLARYFLEGVYKT